MESILSHWGKRILNLATAIALFVGAIAAWDQFMSQYAKAADTRNNSRDLGGLIRLQKSVIEENRRESARRKRENRRESARRRIEKIEEQIYKLEDRYINSEIPRSIQRRIAKKRSEIQRLEAKLN